MAISPDKAEKITSEEMTIIANAERRIDEILSQRYQGSGSVEITDPIERLSDRCKADLLRRFRAAGWDINKRHHEGDFRDPRERSYDSWVFSAGVARRYEMEDSGPYASTEPPPWRD